jgi:hypothetical protein
MLDTIEITCQKSQAPKACQGLLRQVSLLLAKSQVGTLVEADRQAIRSRGEALKEKLGQEPSIIAGTL